MMKKQIRVRGFSYSLRPITIADAKLVIDIRLQDVERNKYIHKIDNDIDAQVAWLNAYIERDNDLYFVIENNFTKEPEGLISIYDIKDGKAEWGRWVLKKGSMAAIESVYLILLVAFEKIGLNEVYSRTIADNLSVVSFHESIKQKQRTILKNYAVLNGKSCDAVEHFIDCEYFKFTIKAELMMRSLQLFKRNIEMQMGEKMEFHHIGVATAEMEREYMSFYMLGYKKTSEIFEDLNQGIKGCFLEAKNQPSIELLENLEGRNTVEVFLASGNKMYHLAYLVKNIDCALDVFKCCRAKVISDCKESVYFGKRICFLILPNRLMIELIEK